MTTKRRRYWLWVEANDPLIDVLDELGARERNAWLVAIVRAGLAPGGYRDIVQAVERLTERLPPGNIHVEAPTVENARANPPPNVAELMDDALSQFGFAADD